MAQNGNAGKDLLQVGRDYFQFIQINISSGKLGIALIACLPIVFSIYGLKVAGDRVFDVYVESRQPAGTTQQQQSGSGQQQQQSGSGQQQQQSDSGQQQQ
ncbi:MAG: hypothetical protein AAFX78_17850, partial [Cyanobacteria bacterium J06638_20]